MSAEIISRLEDAMRKNTALHAQFVDKLHAVDLADQVAAKDAAIADLQKKLAAAEEERDTIASETLAFMEAQNSAMETVLGIAPAEQTPAPQPGAEPAAEPAPQPAEVDQGNG